MSGYQLTKAERGRLALAVHEVSHALVGVLNGATLLRATLTEGGNDGVCEFTEDSFTYDHTRYRRALVAAAGPAAAAIFTHGDVPTVRQLDALLGAGDREELRLASLHSYASSDEQLWAVLPVVRRHWSAIGPLAAKVFAGHAIGHDDVLAALEVTNGGGHESAQLAGLRMGL